MPALNAKADGKLVAQNLILLALKTGRKIFPFETRFHSVYNNLSSVAFGVIYVPQDGKQQ